MSSTTTACRPLVSAPSVARLAQLFAFIAVVAIFPMSLLATIIFAYSPFEVFVGVVLGVILAFAIIIIGIFTPSAIEARRL